MTEQIDRLTSPRVRVRRRGERMSIEERQAAQAKFLDALGRTANITAACFQANISRTIVYVWQEHDAEFGYAFKEANKRANDLLLGEAWQRAMRGEAEYVVSGGKVMTDKDGEPLKNFRKSDRLLERTNRTPSTGTGLSLRRSQRGHGPEREVATRAPKTN